MRKGMTQKKTIYPNFPWAIAMTPFTSASSSSIWAPIHECHDHCFWYLVYNPQTPPAVQKVCKRHIWLQPSNTRPHKKSSFPTSCEWIELVTLVRVLGKKPCLSGSLPDLTHPQVILIVHFSTLKNVISLLVSGQSKLMGRERRQLALLWQRRWIYHCKAEEMCDSELDSHLPSAEIHFLCVIWKVSHFSTVSGHSGRCLRASQAAQLHNTRTP